MDSKNSRVGIVFWVFLAIQLSFVNAFAGKTIFELNCPEDTIKCFRNYPYEVPLQIMNKGESIDHAKLMFVLSKDTIFDEQDYVEQDFYSSPKYRISAGESVSIREGVTFTQEPGDYFLIVMVTSANGDLETGYRWTKIVPLKIIPKEVDIALLGLRSMTATQTHNSESVLELILRSDGSTEIQPQDEVFCMVYLSEDASYDESDKLLAEERLNLRYVPDELPFRETFRIFYADPPPKNQMYLIARIVYVPLDPVGETDLSNNEQVTKIYFSEPRPNLYIGSMVGNADLAFCTFLVDFIGADHKQVLTLAIGNNGTERIENAEIGVYQSKNKQFDASDTLLALEEVRLEPNEEYAYKPSFEPNPDLIQKGYRYVLAVMDPNKLIDEVHETDNSRSVEYIQALRKEELLHYIVTVENIRITADQRYMPYGWSEGIYKTDKDSVFADGVIMHHVNHGNEVSDSVEVGFFFSKDNQFKLETDVELKLIKAPIHGTLIDFEAYVPLDKVTEEEGFFIVYIDPYMKIDEYATSNNLAAYPISVALTPPPIVDDTLGTASVFPNPFHLEINLQDSTELYQLFDLSGKLILQGENTKRIDVPDLSRGVYILRTKEGEQFKVVKE